MTLFRWLSAGILLLVAFFAAVILTLLAMDSVAVSGRLAGWVSGQIGRQVAIDGSLHLELGRTLRFGARGLRLANAPWGTRPDMLTAGSVLLEIDTWSLIDRPVVIRRVEVEGLDLLLERTAAGDNNWDLGPADDAGFAWPEHLPVVVERVAMLGARVKFIGPRLDRPLEARFDALSQERADDGMLVYAGHGLVNDTAFDARLRTSPVERLIEGRDLRLSFAVNLGELALEGLVRVDDLARPVDSSAKVTLRAPGAGYLASRFGIRNLGTGPVQLDADVRPLPENQGVGGAVSGTLGELRLTADGRLIDPAAMANLALRIDVSGPDLSLIGGLAGVDRLPPVPFDLDMAIERNGERLRIAEGRLTLPDARLELKGTIEKSRAIEGTDLEFRLEGSDMVRFRELLRLPGIVRGPFELAGRLREGTTGAEVLELQSKTALGRLKVSGNLGRYPDYYGTRLDFDVDGPNLQVIGRAAGFPTLPAVSFSASGNLEWQTTGMVLRKSTLRAGRDELTLDGRIGRNPRSRDTDLRFTLNGENLRDLSGLGDFGVLPAGAYAIQGRLRREPAASRFDGVRGTMAGATLRFNGRVSDDFARDTDVTIALEGPRLEAFTGILPDYPLPFGKFRLEGGLQLSGQKLQLRNLRLAAAGAEGTADANLALPLSSVSGSFDIRARGPDLARLLPQLGRERRLVSDFVLEARGSARDGRWAIDAARLVTDAGSVVANGALDWQPDFSATALRLEVRAASLADAGRLMGMQLPPEPFEFTAELSGTATALRVAQARGRLGATDFDGRASLDFAKRPLLDLEFQSELLDLTPFLDDPPVAPSAAQAPPDARLIPDTALPLGLLDRFDGRVAVRAQRALVADIALDDLRLIARLRDGGVRLETMELQAPPAGNLSVRGELLPGPGGASIRISASGSQVPLSTTGDTPAQRAARPRADIEVQLAGQGATLRDLARTLNGRLHLVAGAGEVPISSASKLFGNLWREIVATVRPGAIRRTSGPIRCLAVVATAAGGVVRTAPVLAFQTDEANVVSHGLLDLRTETIELFLRTTPRERLDINFGEIVNPYVKVTGPLAKPGLTIDPKGALFSGAIAVVTGGLSIVAKSAWVRLFRAVDPCAEALAAADKLAAMQTPSPESRLLGPLRR
jgi:uncharacterized protein involved in outer membrane biogenesis